MFLDEEDWEFLVLLVLVVVIAWLPFNTVMNLREVIGLTFGVIGAQGMYVYLKWRDTVSRRSGI